MPAKRAQTLGSCSSTAVLGSKWEDLSIPAPGSHLTALRVLCGAAPAPPGALGHCQCSAPPPSLPASLGKLASLPGNEPAVWQEQLCCSAGSSGSPRQQHGPMQTPPVLGAAPGDTGGAGAVRAMPGPRAGSVGTAPRAGQSRADKGEPNPRGKPWI